MSSEISLARNEQRVLVVDGDHESRLQLSTFMAQAGYRVDAVADGNMALTLMQSQPPDLVLLDAQIPRLDGFTVCRAIKANPRCGRTPVVMLSAETGDELRERSRAAGADEAVEKPIQFEHLLEVIDRLFQTRNAAVLHRSANSADGDATPVPVPILGAAAGRGG